jgi:hypothetical protein
MPSVHDLERRSSTELAVECGRVFKNPDQYSKEGSERAGELLAEWKSFQTSPNSDYRKQQEILAKRVANHKLMAEFLARIL